MGAWAAMRRRCMTLLSSVHGRAFMGLQVRQTLQLPQRASALRSCSRPCSSSERSVDDFPMELDLREPTAQELEDVELGKVNWKEILYVFKTIDDLPLNNDVGSDMVVGLGKMGDLQLRRRRSSSLSRSR